MFCFVSRYIALELCSATLQDYVEKKLTFECNIDDVEMLRQATLGLAHLHSMDIGILLFFFFVSLQDIEKKVQIVDK